jgi:hypothetical protein
MLREAPLKLLNQLGRQLDIIVIGDAVPQPICKRDPLVRLKLHHLIEKGLIHIPRIMRTGLARKPYPAAFSSSGSA